MIDKSEPGKSLLWLVKGDPNNLAGEAIIYATVRGKLISHEDPAAQEDFTEDMEDLEALLRKIVICFEEELDKQDTPDQLFPRYTEGSEEDLETESADVVYAGDHSDQRKAELAMSGANLFYMSLYLSQQEMRKTCERGSYEDIARRGGLEAHMSLNFIDLIVKSIKSCDMEARKSAVGKFLKFCAESPMEKESLDLATLLLSDEPNEELLGLYYKLISAVALELDDRASYIRRLINQTLPTPLISSKLPVEVRRNNLRSNYIF